MTVIKNYFKNIIGERIITSYDYLDIAKGKSIQKWYAVKSRTDCILAELTMYSESIETTHQYDSYTANQKYIDVDFDVIFEKPNIIDGLILINLTNGLKKTLDNTACDASTYVIAKIRKWDGTTETELGSATSQTITCTNPTKSGSRINCLDIDIARTKFAIGDTFRVTVEVWASATLDTGNKWTCGFGHDPTNRASPSGLLPSLDTSLIVVVPFRIDI